MDNKVPTSIFLSLYLCLFITGCSSPVLLMTTKVQKDSNITIVIEKFKDYTDKYSEDYAIEKNITNRINKNFRGILLNYKRYSELPRYSKISNPFIAYFINDENKPVDKDILVQGDIETIYYGSVNESIAAGFLALGILGAAITESHNKNNFFAFISVKTRIINCENDSIIYNEIITGKSKEGKITELTQREAIKLAAQDYSEQLLNLLSQKK